jgi:hypothetical protein
MAARRRTVRRKAEAKLSLREASRYAYENGLIGGYYDLHSNEHVQLNSLMERTAWKQPSASKVKGHSQGYAFHQALKRLIRLPYEAERLRMKAVAIATKAQRLEEEADTTSIGDYEERGPYAQPVFVPNPRGLARARALFREAVENYEVAADVFEEAGEMRSAVLVRRRHIARILEKVKDMSSRR